ncbi:nucleotidyl transferase AbiEii/AbiGii toxin family protein [Planctomicrobium piriforme]|uniref:Nucleotidyl transferase AbiEii toxin, Type IV TA system n=1 Tax=Planctomicrobium piriforme TaxID=1576369 RepID=A0A1I3KC72_9PLAN|nr:nucleotidyl transferase AbiEii/AbiGii toxin family protein [Planctomicrobium piriforme]SFI70099.1 hypothetical protein SAMN05421753_111184 [Planctomicrobium piriforme]
MYQVDEFRDCLQRIASILQQFRLRYCLTGGAAFIAYGDPRTTQDVDLIVDVERLRECLPQLLSLLREEQFLLTEETVREAVRSQRKFQLIDLVSTFKFDLYPLELVEGLLDRAVEMEIMPNLHYPIASRPDLIASKVVGIGKGSHKSRRDVRWLMWGATDYEQALARQFIEGLGLTALLEVVLAEPDEIDA